MQGVAPIDEHEHRLKQVIAIRALARDVQKQIQFGRGQNMGQRTHGK
jgi:hypothetical protein